MFSYIERLKQKIIDWFFARAQGPMGQFWLALLAFTESIIFPVPTVALLVPILMADAKRWLYFAAFTSGFSILGGIVGYFVGVLFFDLIGAKIIEFYHLGPQMADVTERFNNNAFLVTFIGAFTPIPYKVFVLAAGFLGVNFFAFVLASVLGRSLQFFLVGYVMKVYGKQVTEVVLKYFNYFVVLGILLLLYIFLT